MSRWLHRLSSRPKVISNVPKGQVQAAGQTTTYRENVMAWLANTTLPMDSRAKQLADREDVLSDQSYQLLVWKLKLMEEETSLTMVNELQLVA